MEVDIDRLAWDDELFGGAPRIENGELVIPEVPGWGMDPNDKALRARPPKL